jgi:2-hydroxychromene-2-carboxylate isomerase
MALEITHFTDPACPFAFSAEPVRQRLRWHYGDALHWHHRMIVLTLEPGHAERLAAGADGLQRLFGMPIRGGPYARPASSEPACRAVVAARIHAPPAHERLLRELRVRTMAGGLLDDPQLIADAGAAAGIDPPELERWSRSATVVDALAEDVAAARAPSRAARALDHKLAGPPDERRYTAPSYEITNPRRGISATIPGFNPVEAYETAIANLDPELLRRGRPGTPAEVLAGFAEPLATAEVAAIAELELDAARGALEAVAEAIPAGADFYWRLPGAS